jgi:hypothetical protein
MAVLAFQLGDLNRASALLGVGLGDIGPAAGMGEVEEEGTIL